MTNTNTNTIDESAVKARAAQIAERQALEELQAEAQQAEQRAAQLRGQAEHNYGAAVNTARARLKALSEVYARRDALAMQIGALASELAVMDKQLAARRADAIEPALLPGRPLGRSPRDVESDTGAREHARVDIEGSDTGTRWARLIVQLVSKGHVWLSDDGYGYVSAGTYTTGYKV